MDNEFRKFATRHMGINSMVLDDVVSMQNRDYNRALGAKQPRTTTSIPISLRSVS